MEPKHFLVFGLILIPYVLSERQCTENGQRIVNDHIENVVDEVCTIYQIRSLYTVSKVIFLSKN